VFSFTREQTLAFDPPETAMADFATCLAAKSKGEPMFVSDNNGFDWQFIN